MKIVFWPALDMPALSASVSGEILKINGDEFDFSPISEGMQLPGEAVGSRWFPNLPITRINGELTVTIKLPVSERTAEDVRSPGTPMFVIVDKGIVTLPDTQSEEVGANGP